jgi:hypothetical protein
MDLLCYAFALSKHQHWQHLMDTLNSPPPPHFSIMNPSCSMTYSAFTTLPTEECDRGLSFGRHLLTPWQTVRGFDRNRKTQILTLH